MDDRIRVLHVEDDADFAELAATFLERADERFEVATAADATEGLDRLGDGTFDCVVSDYEMPGTNGIEFLESVREEYPSLPFILFTGRGSEAVASDAISAGVTDYIQKGTGTELFELLAKRIENAVGQYRTQEELDRQSDLFAKTQRLADVGAWEWYPEQGDGYFTEQIYQIYGIDSRPDKDPMADISKFYHPGDQETIRAAFEGAVRRGEPYDVEVRVVDDEGTIKWVRTRGEPQLENGSCARVSGTLQDITDRKERERELQRQVDRLEEFTGVVSHDLRNPLNVAQGRLALAREKRDDEHLTLVAGALDRMEAIIEDTLTLARQGQTVAETEPVDVSTLVAECWEVVDSGNVQLELIDDFTVQGDRNRLSQLFENLFRNSVEHGSTSSRTQPGEAEPDADTQPPDRRREHTATSRRPRIGERVERGQEQVTIRIGLLSVMHTSTRAEADGSFGFFVEDDGPGIPPERREAVFEPGESSNDDGTGFGLSIVKRVAEAHGWEVELTEGFDGGARVEFRNVR